MVLVIGNKRLSSWSLRPWLVLKHFGIPFEEKLIRLDQPTTVAEIAKYSSAGKVPVLIDEGLTVWESLAICEYLHDKYPEKKMWPSDLGLRAWARSVSSEMHSSFQKMRSEMSHDLQRQNATFSSEAANADIARVKMIWRDGLKKSGGPFLFRDFSIADAMYAPVVNRFVSYAVPMDPAAEADIAGYIKTMRAHPAHQEWISEGLRETYEAPLHT